MIDFYSKNNKLIAITAEEMMVVQDECGSDVLLLVISNICQLLDLLVRDKGMLKNNIRPMFEGRLRAKMGRLEREETVPSVTVQVELETTKEESAMCSFNCIENVPLIWE